MADSAPSEASHPGRAAPRQRLRWLRWLSAAVALILATAVVVYTLRWTLFGGLIREEIATALSDVLATEVRIEQIGGDLFSGVYVGQITIAPGGHLPLAQPATIERVSATWQLSHLLTDEAVLSAISASGITLALTPAPSDPNASTHPEAWGEAIGHVLTLLDAPPDLPEIQVTELELTSPWITGTLTQLNMTSVDHAWSLETALSQIETWWLPDSMTISAQGARQDGITCTIADSTGALLDVELSPAGSEKRAFAVSLAGIDLSGTLTTTAHGSIGAISANSVVTPDTVETAHTRIAPQRFSTPVTMATLPGLAITADIAFADDYLALEITNATDQALAISRPDHQPWLTADQSAIDIALTTSLSQPISDATLAAMQVELHSGLLLGQNINRLEFTADGTPDRLNLTRARLAVPGGELIASGQITRNQAGWQIAKANGNLDLATPMVGLAGWLEAHLPAALELERITAEWALNGSDFSAHGQLGTASYHTAERRWSWPAGTFAASGNLATRTIKTVTWQGLEIPMMMDASARWGADWMATARLSQGDNHIALSLDNAADGLRVGARGAVHLAGPWPQRMAGATLPSAWQVSSGLVLFDAEAHRHDRQWSILSSLNLQAAELQGHRIHSLGLDGAATISAEHTIDVQGQLSAVGDEAEVLTSLGLLIDGDSMHATLNPERLIIANQSVPVDQPITATLTPETISLSAPALEWSGIDLDAASFSLDRNAMTWAGHLALTTDELEAIPLIQNYASGSIHARIAVSGSGTLPVITAAIDAQNLELETSHWGLADDIAITNLTAAVTSDGQRLELEHLTLASPVGHLSGRLGLDLITTPDLRLADHGLDATLTLGCADLAVPVALFWPELEAFQPGGVLEAHLTASGSPYAPKIAGSLSIANGSLASPDPVAPVENLTIAVTAEGDHVSFGTQAAPGMRGEVGGGSFTAWGSISTDLTADLHLTGHNLLLSDGRLLRDLYLRASPDLHLTGPAGAWVLNGSTDIPIAMVHTEFAGGDRSQSANTTESMGVRLPQAVGGGLALPAMPTLPPVALNVSITTPRPVVFSNTVAAGLVAFTGEVRGTLREPALSGEVEVRSGEVRATRGVFLPIDRATLTIPSRPGAGPTVALSSSLSYGLIRVTATVDGALAAPELSLTSDPPYPEEDLMALLLFGAPPEEGSEAAATYLANQAFRFGSALVGDRMPKPIPPQSELFNRFRLEIGDLSQRREYNDLPVDRLDSGGPDTLGRLEYLINDKWSIISAIDHDENLASDIQFRLSFGSLADLGGQFLLPWLDGSVLLDALRVPIGRGYPEAGFAGNTQISDTTLREALSDCYRFLGLAFWSPSARADAAFRIRRIYLDQGYAEAVVRSQMDDDGKLVFLITEGPLISVSQVDFEWINADGTPASPPSIDDTGAILDDAVVRSAMYRPSVGRKDIFAYRTMRAQASSIATFLRSQGWLDAQVSSRWAVQLSDRSTRRIVHRVAAGPRYHLREVSWKGNGPEAWDSKRVQQRLVADIGRPQTHSRSDQLAAIIADDLRSLGHLDPTVRATTTRIDGNGIHIHLDVTPGPQTTVGKIQITGNHLVSDSFIQRAAGLERGEVLTSADLIRTQRRILASRMFRTVSVTSAQSANGDAEANDDVIITVSERAPYELRLRLGYGTVDEFRSGAELLIRSPFGSAESLRIGGEFNVRSYLAEAEYSRSWLLGIPWMDGSLLAFYEYQENDRPSYEQTVAAVVPSIGAALGEWSTARLGLSIARIDETDVNRTYDIVSPFVAFTLDGTDDPRRPHRGVRLASRIETANASLGSDLTYAKITGLAAAYLPLSAEHTLALGVRGGKITTWSDTDALDLPASFRFTTGGATSVRGFRDDSLGPNVGGDLMLGASLELRSLMTENSEIAQFIDIGNAYIVDDNPDIIDELRWSVGNGWRYYTPAGAIIFEIGYNPQRDKGEDTVRLHLSFGRPF